MWAYISGARLGARARRGGRECAARSPGAAPGRLARGTERTCACPGAVASGRFPSFAARHSARRAVAPAHGVTAASPRRGASAAQAAPASRRSVSVRMSRCRLRLLSRTARLPPSATGAAGMRGCFRELAPASWCGASTGRIWSTGDCDCAEEVARQACACQAARWQQPLGRTAAHAAAPRRAGATADRRGASVIASPRTSRHRRRCCAPSRRAHRQAWFPPRLRSWAPSGAQR